MALGLCAGCGSELTASEVPSSLHSTRASATPDARADEQRAVRLGFAAACDALARGDERGWREALSATSAVRGSLDDVFGHLAPLGLTAPSAEVSAVPGREHAYLVQFTGSLGAAGPHDRLLAERVLIVHTDCAANETGTAAASRAPEQPAIRCVADDTPPAVLRQHVMAFAKPRLMASPGVVVVYEKAWRTRATRLAEQARAARRVVGQLYGLEGGRTVVLSIFASRAQVVAALGAGDGEVDDRIKYFAHPAPSVSGDLWSPVDVGVVAPALNGLEDWAPVMLRHEIAHAYTLGWFFGTAHPSEFLQEGLAVAAEGARDWSALKRTLAANELDPPLCDAIALGDLWAGRETEDVRILYSAAGALVHYVRERWGREVLHRWTVAVCQTTLSADEIAVATKAVLGVTWDRFVSGWRAYVEALP